MQTIKSLSDIFKLYLTFIALLVGAIFFLSCNPTQSTDLWPSLDPLPLDPDIEAQIDEILPNLL